MNMTTVSGAGALAILAAVAVATPACAASLTRSVEVHATPAQVWKAIGPFCSIKDWHPAIGQCTEAGHPSTRTLVTKDGKATFVEQQTARGPRAYSYAIKSSPLPITHYRSTLGVAAAPGGMSKITWSSTYTPNPGQDKAGADALIGVYDGGLGALKAKFGG